MRLRRPRAGPNPIGSGTGLRFVLLLVLVAASTVTMASDHIVLRRVLGDPRDDILGCELAAGFDPAAGFWENALALEGRNRAAMTTCATPYEPPWWVSPAAVGTVFALAAVLCWAMPWWTVRRRGLRPIADSSPDGAALRGLAADADVRSARFLADWASTSTNAVAFGRPGRPRIALGAGLLQSRTAYPDRFTATVLHELAHLRARDVGFTYATVALWRVFVVVVLLPYLARLVELVVRVALVRTSGYDDVVLTTGLPVYVRTMGLCLFTALLVYLSRSDILRTRELYADRRAVECGASRAVWDTAARAGSRTRRRVRAAHDALFSAHPTWAQRARALRDPGLLVRVPATPTFLTGAAAALINEHLQAVPGLPAAEPVQRAATVLAAVLVAGTTCLTLWRRTAHALATEGDGPSGARAGFWLGAGLAVGSLLGRGPVVLHAWLPPGSWSVVLLVVLALILTCWTTGCARLLLAVVPPAARGVVLAVGLVGTAGVFAYWLDWWTSVRALFLPGYFTLLREFTARELGGADPSSTSVTTLTVAVLAGGSSDQVLLWSTAVLWLVPLVAWVGPASGSWMTARHGWPSLRRTVGIGAVTAVLALVLALGTAVLRLARTGPPDLAETAWILAAVLAALLVVPLGVAVAAAARGRNGMLVGAVVTGVAFALCGAVLVVLAVGVDCVLPALTSAGPCVVADGPEWAIATGALLVILGPVTLATVVVAVCVATALAPLRARAPRPAPEPDPEPWTRERTAVLARRRVAVGAVLALVAVLTLLPGIGPVLDYYPKIDPLEGATAPAAATPQARSAQVVAWVRHGGGPLMRDLDSSAREMADGAARLGAGDRAGAVSLRSGCAGIVRWAGAANAYFTVPDPDQQAAWERAQSIAASAGADCSAALDAGDGDALMPALNRLLEAARLGYPVLEWIQAQLPANPP